MSWIHKLYETYERNIAFVGEKETPLLPVGHTTQKRAHIQITLDGQGSFLRASVVPDTDARTIIPATEESAGRTSGEAPHPLCDKLQYVAADYQQFGGEKSPYFQSYRDQIEEWCSSPFSHPKVRAVLQYVKRGTVIKDLIHAGILHVGEDGKLLKKWEGSRKTAPEIFNSTKNAGGQTDAFVRWCVELPGDPQRELRSDRNVWRSWIDYYASTKNRRGLCYVTGEEVSLADQHPRKIRSDGDGAKLISSNDETGYTFRGRFVDADQACGVGFEVTQKAHYVLRWLIARQGFVEYVKDSGGTKPSLAVVAWAVSGARIPDPFADTLSLLSETCDNLTGSPTNYTAQEAGTHLSKLIAGYSAELGATDDVVVLALDSATPGRMAIRFYRELTSSDFLDRVQSWHDVENGCTWLQHLSEGRVFLGAPAPRDMAEAAYGVYRDENGQRELHIDERLRRATIERLLPCIVDGTPIPRDLVESCVRRASNRNGLEPWEWERALGIACALYRYQNKERRYLMALERDRRTRDYLYGRLLAVAERLEGQALYLADESRETNAARLMQRFADRPLSTWRTIETSLTPYRLRLRARQSGFLQKLDKEVDGVMATFEPNDFLSDRPLTGEFLLGYHCQRAELWVRTNQDSTDNVESKD